MSIYHASFCALSRFHIRNKNGISHLKDAFQVFFNKRRTERETHWWQARKRNKGSSYSSRCIVTIFFQGLSNEFFQPRSWDLIWILFWIPFYFFLRRKQRPSRVFGSDIRLDRLRHSVFYFSVWKFACVFFFQIVFPPSTRDNPKSRGDAIKSTLNRLAIVLVGDSQHFFSIDSLRSTPELRFNI